MQLRTMLAQKDSVAQNASKHESESASLKEERDQLRV
jgi:hypothetical protein